MKQLSGLLVLAGVCAALLSVGQAANAVTFTFQTTSQTLTELGLDPSFPNSDYDHMLVGGMTGSVTVDPGAPVVVDVNSLTFEAGPNRYNVAGPFLYDILRDMTIGSQTQSLAQLLEVSIGYSDSFVIHEGNPVVFAGISPGMNLEVTPLGVSASNISDTWNGHLQAQFRLVEAPTAPASVPEPGVVQFSAALGMCGLGLLRLRRRTR